MPLTAPAPKPEPLDSPSLRVYATAWPVTALGPGQRFVIWVSGCGRRCPGCISPEMQPLDAGKKVPIPLLMRRIRTVPVHLDGITISGGEPLDQPEGLNALLSAVRAERPDWSVMVYTGYTLTEITDHPARRATVIQRTDIIIEGPFRAFLPSEHPLKGSANQRIIALSDRGRALLRQLNIQALPRFNAGLGAYNSSDMIIGIPPLGRDACGSLSGKSPCGT